ncbi:AraC family transcriptional regulator [Aquimarina algiphila]|uniref:AraC family transcriptional regulator n=1 Tax=Aquimarina algiphila TaxID=2047982 RepID=UPI00232F5836|nr:AraC family transcriptional regulator [Aquimarina algiphila]
MKIIREVTPVKSEDPFIILKHENARFDYPLHFHPEYEINFILNFSGKRIVGDSIEDCENTDLVLIGPYLQHIWKTEECTSNATVITIQFQENFLGSKLLNYDLFKEIKELLEFSRKGITFSNPTKDRIGKKIIQLCEKDDFDTFLLFLEILKDLAISSDKKILASSPIANHISQGKSRRINAVLHYIENNYANDITLSTIAKIANMSESAFSHFFKKRTNMNFTQYILDFRIRVATKLLLETEMAINEISYKSGFKTLSNFNRTFKRKQGSSPREYRKNYIKEVINESIHE